MILYTEEQLKHAYDSYRKEHMKLGIPMATQSQFRIIYQNLLDMIFSETFEARFPIQFVDDSISPDQWTKPNNFIDDQRKITDLNSDGQPEDQPIGTD